MVLRCGTRLVHAPAVFQQPYESDMRTTKPEVAQLAIVLEVEHHHPIQLDQEAKSRVEI